jgi:hypothetical protein
MSESGASRYDRPTTPISDEKEPSMSRAKQRKLETDELAPTYAAREMAK